MFNTDRTSNSSIYTSSVTVTCCQQSLSCCSRPLLFVANWKYFCVSLPMDTGKQSDDYFVMCLQSSSMGCNINNSITVTTVNVMLENIFTRTRVHETYRLQLDLVTHKAQQTRSWSTRLCQAHNGEHSSWHVASRRRQRGTRGDVECSVVP